MDVEIRDDELRPLVHDENGEIWMRSPTLIRGYWRKPEATAETIVDGWLRSGDLGHIDDDGYLFVADRVKDMILRAGENVYSAEVEAAIYEHPAVYEAAVFGLPDERLGEVVACVVMLKPGQDLSEDELRTHLQTRLANFKIPTRVAFTDDAAAAQRRRQVLEARDAGDLLPLSRRDRRSRVLGDVHRLEVGQVEPRRVVGRAVHLVVEFAAGQFDGEEDAHGVDLVAVVATAHVAGDPEQRGMLDRRGRSLRGTLGSACPRAPRRSRCRRRAATTAAGCGGGSTTERARRDRRR